MPEGPNTEGNKRWTQWSEAELALKQDRDQGGKEMLQVLLAGSPLAISFILDCPRPICYSELLSHHRTQALCPRAAGWGQQQPLLTHLQTAGQMPEVAFAFLLPALPVIRRHIPASFQLSSPFHQRQRVLDFVSHWNHLEILKKWLLPSGILV